MRGYNKVAAYLSSLVAILNLIYVSQLNVFLQIRHIVAFHDQAAGPTEGGEKDFNQAPLNSDNLDG